MLKICSLLHHQGNWKLGFLRPIAQATPFEAELRSLLRALQMAGNHSLTPFLINADSKDLIKAIQEGNLTYENIISECR